MSSPLTWVCFFDEIYIKKVFLALKNARRKLVKRKSNVSKGLGSCSEVARLDGAHILKQNSSCTGRMTKTYRVSSKSNVSSWLIFIHSVMDLLGGNRE